MSQVVRVAAAVIVAPDGRVLLAQRPPGKPYAGYWEFPGGKLEHGETPLHALRRELHEELGIDVLRAAPWLVQEFVYPHAHVELNFFRVFAFGGQLHGRDGQAFAWQVPGAFEVAPLLPANTTVLKALALPPVLGISCADVMGEETFLASAELALLAGLRFIQLREKTWLRDRLAAFVPRVVALAREHGARVLLNGEADDARAFGCDGVHWSSARLRVATGRPQDLVVGASCHDVHELALAGRLGCDFAVMGPVLPTSSHPGAASLGWQGFARAVQATRLPVYALGGLDPGHLDAAIAHGAHGIAMRRGAWPAVERR